MRRLVLGLLALAGAACSFDPQPDPPGNNPGAHGTGGSLGTRHGSATVILERE